MSGDPTHLEARFNILEGVVQDLISIIGNAEDVSLDTVHALSTAVVKWANDNDEIQLGLGHHITERIINK